MNRKLGKPSRFGNLALSDQLLGRHVYTPTGVASSHTTLTVGNEQAQVITQPMRVRAAQVGTVTGGTVTVQVYADGRPLFDDSQRPVSGGAPKDVTDLYVISTGTVLTSTIEADSGVPASTANVAIDAESYRLLPQQPMVELHGKKRWRISERRAADLANAGQNLIAQDLTGRTSRPPVTTAAKEQQAAQATPGSPVGGGPGGHGGPGNPPRPPLGGGPRPGGR